MFHVPTVVMVGVDESGLTDGQKTAMRKIRSGETVFVTGAAGTGKSYLVKLICLLFQSQGKSYLLTATTGTAGLLIGGATLHSTLGVGVALHTHSVAVNVQRIRRNKLAMQAWKADVLIIDEVSMLSADSFDKLNAVAKIVRKSDEFFGGMQLVLFGDFFQLAPIDGRFIFFAESWTSGVTNVVVLTDNMRQTKGSDFERCLNQVRLGVVDSESLAFLHGRSEVLVELEKRKKRKAAGEVFAEEEARRKRKAAGEEKVSAEEEVIHTELGGEEEARFENLDEVDAVNEVDAGDIDFQKLATRICTTNRISDSINDDEYDKLTCRESTFPRRTVLLDKEYASALQTSLEKCQAPEVLKLRVGCRVMLLRNLKVSDGLCNGTTGVITTFSPMGYPVVRFDDDAGASVATTDGVIVEPCKYETFDPLNGTRLLYVISQIPLRLAWSMTVHKSQGASLARVVVDLQRTFAAGQAYVSLSRCRSAAGLVIKNFNPRHIFADPDVVEFYKKYT